MKIIKHGNPDIIKNYTTTFTCDRCGCEFTANTGDLTEALADNVNAVNLFVNLLGNTDNSDKMSDPLVYKTRCPDCGRKLSKTKAELLAED